MKTARFRSKSRHRWGKLGKKSNSKTPSKKKEVVKEPKLIVQRQTDGVGAYNDIVAGTNSDVLPGQVIQLNMNLVVDPPPKKVDAWQWGDPKGTIPGVIFKDYTADQPAATLTAMAAADFTNQTIKYYWADHGGAAREVKAMAMIGKVPIKGSGTLKVISPTATFTPTQGTVGFNAGKTKIGLYANPGTTDTDGITYKGKVDVPAPFAAGKWNWVQRAKDGNKLTAKDGTKLKGNNFGIFVLDTTYPYEPAPYKPHPGDGTVAGTAGGYATGQEKTDQDSPDSGNLVVDDSATKRSTSDSFEMYLMFLPAGTKSRYVPLKYISWTYKYAATNTPALGVANWAIDMGSNVGVNAPTVSPVADTSTHPQWTANIAPFNWVADNPVPTVTSIAPATGKNNGTVDITNLAGTNLVAGATVQLKKGTDIINATNVVVVSATKITCTFDLRGCF